MSLAEVPRNHIRRNGQVTHPQDVLQAGRLQKSLHHGKENYQTSQDPSVVQSMLKNSTELGDVGQFVHKPPRIPVVSSQVSSATPSKGRSRSIKRRQISPYHDSPIPSNGPHVLEHTRQVVTASKDSDFRTQDYRAPLRRPSLEGNGDYAMTQSSYNSHSLTHRHPKTNGPTSSRGGVSNLRPRSPYAYPTRLKRPGYRPSSPAFGDINKSTMSYGPGLSREASTRTASPFSAYNANRAPSPFHHVINQSDPDLQHYPPYLAMEPKRHQNSSLTSTRASTPRPSPSVTSISSSSRVQRRRSNHNSGRVRPRSPHVAPLYYDYTEEFEEPGNYRDSIASSAILSRQSLLPLERSTYSERDESPQGTSIAELPTENSPQKVVTQSHSSSLDSGSCETDQCPGNFLLTAPQDLSDVLELSENETPTAANKVSTATNQHSQTRDPLRRPSSRVTSHSLEAKERMLTSDDDPWSHSNQELAAEVMEAQSSQILNSASNSPPTSMFSAKSSPPDHQPHLTPEPIQVLPALSTPHLKPRKLAIDTHERGNPAKAHGSRLSEPLRASSFEGHSRVSTEILSPTPERSIISPSSRDRFSKILSIDESPMDQEPLPLPPKIEERVDTPMQRIQSAEIWKTSDALEFFRRKRSLYSRNSPLKHITPSRVPVEDSSSEEEPELTPGLRQTFCKDEKPLSIYDRLSPSATPPPKPWTQDLAGSAGMENSSIGYKSPPSLSISPGLTKGTYEDEGQVKTRSTPVVSANEAKPPSNMYPVPLRLPKKQPSFRSYSPPDKPSASDLPFDFAPIIHRVSEDALATETEAARLSSSEKSTMMCKEEVSRVVEPASEVHSSRNSIATVPDSIGSRPTSRPWNQDSSYPWNDMFQSLDVTMPQETVDSSKSTEKPPRFKYNVQRASSSTGGMNKLRKEMLPSRDYRKPVAFSLDLGQGPAFQRRRDPGLSVLPGQINSSHDSMYPSRQKTRFVDTFEAQSPARSLFPPSPNHEVRSFFSDDSSQIRSKGAFRKQFSNFKARAAAVRRSSVDETRGYDRGLLSSALGRSRASGRSSRQSQNTAGASTHASVATRIRLKLADKLRLWIHRGEDKVRDWGWKIRYRSGKNRAASAPM